MAEELEMDLLVGVHNAIGRLVKVESHRVENIKLRHLLFSAYMKPIDFRQQPAMANARDSSCFCIAPSL